MRNKCVTNHVLLRNETYYFLKRVPYDLKDYYSVKRLCFSLKTKSYVSALRITKSVLQRLEDYWLGIRCGFSGCVSLSELGMDMFRYL